MNTNALTIEDLKETAKTKSLYAVIHKIYNTGYMVNGCDVKPETVTYILYEKCDYTRDKCPLNIANKFINALETLIQKRSK